MKVYDGETASSGRLRGIEHWRGKDSVLYKHKITEHKGEEMEVEMEITGVFKDALSRQALLTDSPILLPVEHFALPPGASLHHCA